jgi:hypothetical protein
LEAVVVAKKEVKNWWGLEIDSIEYARRHTLLGTVALHYRTEFWSVYCSLYWLKGGKR